MLKYPCLILDHDDTVVQSEATTNYPYFSYILDQFRPGQKITLKEYIDGCCQWGFVEMCRRNYRFTDAELDQEYKGWKSYIKTHIPAPYPGIASLIARQKASGGLVCVVSHSSEATISRVYMTHFLEQIMQIYHLAPEQLLVVDDLKPAYDMAKKVNVPIAFAAWSKLEQPEIYQQMSALCDYTFNAPKALENFLFE